MELVASRVDLASRRVFRGQEELSLTSTEAALLAYLAAHPGRDIPREELLAEVWGYASGVASRTVDTLVRTLRSKIEQDPRRPHHVLSVYGVGYRFEIAEAPPAPAAGRLPAERGLFVGRAREREQILGALARSRAVTLFGMGGTGKTRLACQIARNEREGFPGGVWLCDLIHAVDAAGIALTVAGALGMALPPDPIAALGRSLSARGRCLLLLDSAERAVEGAREVIAAWLDLAPEAHLLVTSRRALGLPGEELIELYGLPPESDAVTLLCERIRSSVPGWSPAEEEMPALLAIAQRLEGIPLSLELAAYRVRLMAPAELARRLGERLDLLAGPPGASARHETLGAVIDWSLSLLGPEERAAALSLSVFEGSFDLPSAEAVLGPRSPSGRSSVDLLQSLADCALISRSPRGRLSMLACVRERLAQQLDERSRAIAYERHAACFARYGTRESLASIERADETALIAGLFDDLDDILAAADRSIEGGDPEVAASAALAASAVITLRGSYFRSDQLLTRALSLPSSRAPLLWLEAGRASRACGQIGAARERFERALSLAQSAGDRRVCGIALGALGFLAFREGRLDEAMERYESALSILLEAGERSDALKILRNRGQIYKWRGQFAQARADLDRVLVYARETGDRRCEAVVLVDLGDVAQDERRFEESEALYDAARALAERIWDKATATRALGNLGRLLVMSERYEDARRALEGALSAHIDSGYQPGEANVRIHIGMIDIHKGQLEQALRQFERATHVCRESGDREWEASSLSNSAHIHALAGRSAPAREQMLRAQSLLQDLGHASLVCGILVDRSVVALFEGQIDEAESLASEVIAGASADPTTRARAHVQLARLALSRGLLREASERCEAARVLGPDSADSAALQSLLGTIAARQGDRAEAERRFADAEQILGDRAPMCDRIELALARAESAPEDRDARREVVRLLDKTDLGPSSPLRRRLAALGDQLSPPPAPGEAVIERATKLGFP